MILTRKLNIVLRLKPQGRGGPREITGQHLAEAWHIFHFNQTRRFYSVFFFKVWKICSFIYFFKFSDRHLISLYALLGTAGQGQ